MPPSRQEVDRNGFFSNYLQMAEAVLCQTKIRSGRCLQLNAGNGLLSIALAKISALDMYLSEESLDLERVAVSNVKAAKLESRFRFVRGKPGRLNGIADQSVHLIISQRPRLLKDKKNIWEIYRLLVPDGVVCIGWDDSNQLVNKRLGAEVIGRNWEQLERLEKNHILRNLSQWADWFSKSWHLAEAGQRRWIILTNKEVNLDGLYCR